MRKPRKPLVGDGIPHEPPIYVDGSDGPKSYQLDRTGRVILRRLDLIRWPTFGMPSPEVMEMQGGKGFEAAYRARLKLAAKWQLVLAF